MSLHGQKPMLDFKKRGGEACKPSLLALCVCVVWLAALNPLGFNKQCLKIHVVASYPESHMHSCVYRTAALEKRSIVLCDFYIRAVSYRRSLFCFFRAWCISAFVGLHNLYIGVASTYLIHLLGSRREFLFVKPIGCRTKHGLMGLTSIKSCYLRQD